MAGFFGFFDYTKPGKGVKKEEYKPDFSTFVRIFTSRFWKILRLNMLFVVCSLPLIAVLIMFYPLDNEGNTDAVAQFMYYTACLLYLSVVGFSPVMAGFTYVLRNFARDRHSWGASDFFEHILKNIKQSLVLLVMDSIIFFTLWYLFSVYTRISGLEGADNILIATGIIGRTIILIISAVYFIMHFYIYQIIITFDMKLNQILKNSFIFTVIKLPRNIGVVLLMLVASSLAFGFISQIGLILSFFILPAAICFTVSFITAPVIEKYMMPQKTDNTEA
ncbi:MAG: hypothetical protein BWY15_00103 [Firmicutes bacterium ADurb.Bin193]|nr:MAG: hypothetical protein BWY15_00103 [Firmicutes bacterium ADurb.Bin193]